MRGMRSTAKQPDPVLDHQAANLAETWQFMWPYFWQFRWHVAGAFFCLFLAKAATLALPYGLKLIIDDLDPRLQAVIAVPVLLVVWYGLLRFGSVFFGEVRDALFSRITEHAMRQLSLRVFKHLHQLDLQFHLDRQTGGISRDIERGTNGLSFLMRFLMFNIVPTLLEIAAVAVIFWALFSVWYAVVTAIAVVVYVRFTVVVTEWRNRYIREANQADSSTNSKAVDSLLNYETVKYFNNEAYEAQNYDHALAGWEKARLQNRMSLFALNSGQALIIALAMTLMMWMASGAVAANEDVRGFDVAMHDAALVRMGDAGADLVEDLEGLRGFESLRFEQAAEVAAVDELAHEEMSAIGGLALIEHADDVFMTELRHGADFVFKACGDLGIASETACDDLDGDDLAIVKAFRAFSDGAASSSRSSRPLFMLRATQDGHRPFTRSVASSDAPQLGQVGVEVSLIRSAFDGVK